MTTRDASIGSLIRKALCHDGNRMIMISADARGWQVSMKQPSGNAFTVEIHCDPIEAVYRCLVDFHDREPEPPSTYVPDLSAWRYPPQSHDMFGPVTPKEAISNG